MVIVPAFVVLVVAAVSADVAAAAAAADNQFIMAQAASRPTTSRSAMHHMCKYALAPVRAVALAGGVSALG